MKVALLLSGQFRDGVDCFNALDMALLKKYNPDVFISYQYSDAGPECSINDLVNLYNPTMIEFQQMPYFVNDTIHKLSNYPTYPETNRASIVYMWYGIQRANNLKTKYENIHNFKYDIVIKSRFDLKILEENIELKERENFIFIPIGWDHRGGYNDLFAYGDSNSMNHYCSTFDYLVKYTENGCMVHPESLLKAHLHNSELGIMRTSIKSSLRGMLTHELDYGVK